MERDLNSRSALHIARTGFILKNMKGTGDYSTEGVPTDLFRDPKVWKHDDTYYVVCGASQNGFAQARLYKSTDMFHWEFVNVLAESRGEWGYMWECPVSIR